MKLDACIETIEEAKAAAEHKLNRVELCAALELGGLTPSAALIEASSKIIETHVMIRPRAGNFVYSTEELVLMKLDIEIAAKLGATGVVFGCLTDLSALDASANASLAELSKSLGLTTTFHRAIDFTFNMREALEVAIELGFDRVLTSGGQATAYNGLNQIMALITLANGRIEIMAGSGVSEDNIKTIKAAGVDAAHFSIRKKQIGMASLNMGEHYSPNSEKIESILNALA